MTADKRALIPGEAEDAVSALNLSPGLLSGDFVFVTGMTGSAPDGTMPKDPATQFRNAFAKIAEVLREAGLTFDAVVDMTSYHVGLKDHFDLFAEIRATFVTDPYPAWTAVEVAGLRREGALAEIKVIATTKPLG